jgi:hypothetical protein
MDRNQPRVGPLVDEKREAGDPLSMKAVLKYFMGAVGLVMIFAALMLIFNVFGLVRDMVASPEEHLARYLDGWETTLASPPERDEEAMPLAENPLPPEPAPALETEEGETSTVPLIVNRRRSEKGEASKPGKPSFLDILNKIFNAAVDGNFSRPLGAFFVLVFTLILVKIPFTLLRLGVYLLRLLVSLEKDEKTPSMPSR